MAKRKHVIGQTFSAEQIYAFTMALAEGAAVEDAERAAQLPANAAHLALIRADVQAGLSRLGDARMLLAWSESVRQLEAHVRGGELAPALLLRVVQTLSAHMVQKAQLQHELDKTPDELQAKLAELLRTLSRMGGMEIALEGAQ